MWISPTWGLRQNEGLRRFDPPTWEDLMVLWTTWGVFNDQDGGFTQHKRGTWPTQMGISPGWDWTKQGGDL
jgi:hypothetical protein